MGNERFRVSLLQAFTVTAEVIKHDEQRRPYVLATEMYVSPIGVRIQIGSHEQDFFIPWSNVTGIQYLNMPE